MPLPTVRLRALFFGTLLVLLVLVIVRGGNSGMAAAQAITVGPTLDAVVGNLIAGYSGDGGPATSAELNSPDSIAFDNAGNLYILDSANNVIRKVSTAGIITTIAGNGTQGFSGDGGPATSAEMNAPTGIAVDSASNLYISDFYNNRIRKVAAGTGIRRSPATALQAFAAMAVPPRWQRYRARRTWLSIAPATCISRMG